MTKHDRTPSPVLEGTELRLFVYGTLKRGFENHLRFFEPGIGLYPACGPGVLFDTPWNHPVARVPSNLVLACGSLNVTDDLVLQDQLSQGEGVHDGASVSARRSCHIQGEILILENPEQDLPRLDLFEEFSPGDSASRFTRVLVWVCVRNRWVTAWMYAGGSIFEKQVFHELPSGFWPEAGTVA